MQRIRHADTYLIQLATISAPAWPLDNTTVPRAGPFAMLLEENPVQYERVKEAFILV